MGFLDILGRWNMSKKRVRYLLFRGNQYRGSTTTGNRPQNDNTSLRKVRGEFMMATIKPSKSRYHDWLGYIFRAAGFLTRRKEYAKYLRLHAEQVGGGFPPYTRKEYEAAAKKHFVRTAHQANRNSNEG